MSDEKKTNNQDESKDQSTGAKNVSIGSVASISDRIGAFTYQPKNELDTTKPPQGDGGDKTEDKK